MTPATLILVMLMGGGYWFGGQQHELVVQWVSPKDMPQAEVRWALELGKVKLTSATQAMPEAGKPLRIALTMPEVRTETQLQWSYQILRADNAQILEAGSIPIHVYPRNFLSGWGKVLKDRKLIVCDAEGSLFKWLDQESGVPCQQIRSLDALPLAGADLIVVAENQLDDRPFAQSALLQQAEAGAGVLILSQREPTRIAGLSVVDRQEPAKLRWRTDHRLLARMDQPMLDSLLKGHTSLRAVAVGPHERVLEQAWWPRAEDNAGGDAMECLLCVKSVGKGRVVLCQLPLGNWSSDPRSGLLLANALEFLTTVSAPITPWGDRPKEPLQPTKQEQPTIRLP